VINDGSTDDTLAVLKRAFQLFPVGYAPASSLPCGAIRDVYHCPWLDNFAVIDKARGGKADGLNAALNLAKGSIFLTVDADSFLHPRAIEKLVAAICQDEAIVAAGGTVKAGNGAPAAILASNQGCLPQGLLPKLQWIEYAT